MSCFNVCCGEGDEEAKYGSFVPSDADFDTMNEESEKSNGRRAKIQSIEGQISVFNKASARLKRKKSQCRCTINNQPIDLSEDFAPPKYPKSKEDCAFLQKALQRNFLFTDLNDQERQLFIDAMQQEVVSKDAVIIEQGDTTGDFFYIVQSGQVDYDDNGVHVGSCQDGGSFGELALLYNSPRAVSCIAASETVSLWKVDQKTFRYLLARNSHGHQQDIKEVIKRITLFEGMDDATIAKFIGAMTPVRWSKGDRVVQKGQVGNVFYIILDGEVKIHDIGLGDSRFEDMICKSGDWFGERALLTNEPRAANVTALTDVTTLAMDRETFEEAIGPLQNVMEHEMRRKFLKGLPLFSDSSVSEPEIDQLVDLMEEVCYRKGDKLVESGKPFEMNLWIIRHGRLLIYCSEQDKIFNLQSGDYYIPTENEYSSELPATPLQSIHGDHDHISSHSAVCEENLTTWVLTRKDIESVIGDVARLSESSADWMQLSGSVQDSTLRLGDLKKHRMLGQGAFGKVWLVSDKNSKESVYALKAVSKRKLLDSKQEHSVLREKEFLCLLQHPFILSLVASFQDADNLYLLLPVIPGGELFSVLHNQDRKVAGLPNNDAAFYSGCVVEAIGHFHQRQIAYRDLKLENILIDEAGYCKIVDLGFAKVVEDKTFTLVGTPEYLAPEIIMSKGHDKAVDYWSLGVLVYELLVGQSPFYKRGSSQIDMFKRIVLVKYDIPSDKVNGLATVLIEKLLTRRQAHRLGNLSKGYLDVKANQWFEDSGVVFKKLLRKEQEAPWVPDVKSPFDASNFDDLSSLEKEVDTGKHLTKDEQDVFKDF